MKGERHFAGIGREAGVEGQNIQHFMSESPWSGEAVVGANLFRDLFAGIRDIVGGRSGAYEKELRKARDHAFEEITEAVMSGRNTVSD
jgi:uncharacterized protein YbjQ (UPF0145 family)